MDSIQIHLMLNHLPSIGQIIGLIIFLAGWFKAVDSIKTTGVVVLLCSAISILPVSRSGELAEERVEKIAGISEAQIETHEDAAGQAWVMTVVTGLISIIWLVVNKKYSSYSRYTSVALAISALIAVALVLNASHQGGLIRHPELQGVVNSSTPAETEAED
jgi:hypothetical protein